MNNIAIICNKYAGSLRRIINNPIATVEGEMSLRTFQDKVTPVFRMEYLDIVVLDHTALKEEFLEAVKYLKVQLPQRVRLIVLYPNLPVDELYQQMLVYGVYDIVNPDCNPDKMNDMAIDKKITSDLLWALQEPTTFANIVDKLDVHTAKPNEEAPVEKKPLIKLESKQKPKKGTVKPRLIGFYGITDRSFNNIISDGKYNVVGIYPSVGEQDIGNADIIVIDRCSEADVAYIASLVAVNQHKAVITAGYEREIDFPGVSGVNYFTYDMSPADFARQVSINSIKTLEQQQNSSAGNQTFALYGVKGGVGTTVITAIMAQNFAKKNPDKRVCAVDFSSRAGDLGEKFGIDKPNLNIHECVLKFLEKKNEHLDINNYKSKIIDYCFPVNGVYVMPTSQVDIYEFTDRRYSTSEIAQMYRFVLKGLKEQFDAVFIDVTKFGGYCYDIALQEATRIILVSDGKIASTNHLLHKIGQLKDDSRVSVIINRIDTRHNETEFDDVNIIRSKFDKDRIIELPVDKHLLNETKEMAVKHNKKIDRELNRYFVNAVPDIKKKRK